MAPSQKLLWHFGDNVITEFTNSASFLYSRPETPPVVATVALFGALTAGTGGFYTPVNAALVTEWTSFPAIAISEIASNARKKALQADSIPKAILQIRDRLGLRMSELADIFGVSRQAVYLWLKGENVKNEYIQRIRSEERRVGKECRSRWSPCS